MLGLTKMVRGLALSPAIQSPQIKMLGLQILDLQGLGVKALGVQDVRYGHNSIRDLRKDYSWKRERPLGPHRHKPPNLIGNAASLNYKHKVHYPEDGKYTVKPLKITKLGGRHPITGRKVIQGVGGGRKQRFRWIDWVRLPADWPRDGTVLEERVTMLKYDPLRAAQIMMTGYGTHLRWQVATDQVKEGDLIRTHTAIPVNPIRPVEGDSHPLGALPQGTTVCLVETWPGEGAMLASKAEENCKVMRKVEYQGSTRVVVKCNNDREYAIPQEAQCVVGTVSIHPLKALPIGSPNRKRWLGMAPRSGLWQRKDGRKGRKIKKPPPTIYTMPYEEYHAGVGTPSNPGFKCRTVILDNLSEGKRGRIRAGKRCVPDAPVDSKAYKREIRPGFDGKNPGTPNYTYGVIPKGTYSADRPFNGFETVRGA